MKKNENYNNIKLGVFVLAGMVTLILSFYMIGAKQNVFGSNIFIKARFKDISGLTTGNNVRFSGLQAGVVKSIKIINDTTIEVNLVINKSLQSFIQKNATAAIANEGLMGNKVINILPGTIPAPQIEDGDLIPTKIDVSTDAMLSTLNHTNTNAETISEDVKYIIKRLNNNNTLWQVLEDTTVAKSLKSSLTNFHKVSEEINTISLDLHHTIIEINKGEGIAGMLLTNKKSEEEMKDVLNHIAKVSENADRLSARLDSVTKVLQKDISTGPGPVHTLLTDTADVRKINNTLTNLEKGTLAFKEDMEALKQNFLFKKYFKNEEKKKRKEDALK